MSKESLLETADRETNEAEAAIASGAAKKDAKNGKASGQVAGKIEPLIGTETKPGAQGTATQEDDGFKAPDYVPPDPTKEQVQNATSVFVELQGRARDMGAERVIEAACALDYPRQKLQIQVEEENIHASGPYLRNLAEVLTKRALTIAVDRAQSLSRA